MAGWAKYEPFNLNSAYPLDRLGNLLQTPQRVDFMDAVQQDTERLAKELQLEGMQRQEDFSRAMEANPQMSMDELEQEAKAQGLLANVLALDEAQRKETEGEIARRREERQLREIEERLTRPMLRNSGSDVIAIDPTTNKTTVIYKGKEKGTSEKEEKTVRLRAPDGSPISVPKKDENKYYEAGYVPWATEDPMKKAMGELMKAALENSKAKQSTTEAGPLNQTLRNNKVDQGVEQNKPKGKARFVYKDE